MKKILLSLLAVCTVFFGVLGLGACAEAHTHDYTATVTAPTCTEEGYTTYSCSCGSSYVDDKVSATGHTQVSIEGKDATCTEDGLTEGAKCSICNQIVIAQEVIPALGHKEDVVLEGKDATCTEDGLTVGSVCSVCGETVSAQEVIPALGHVAVVDAAIAPTCTQTGLSEGSHCGVCGEVIVAQTEVAATGHKDVTVSGYAPTCTASGLSDGAKCEVCGVVTVEQTVIPATGHNYKHTSTVAPTCAQKGYDIMYCVNCGDAYRTNYVDTVSHVYDEEVAEAAYLKSEATCTSKAVYYKSCVCGEKGSDTFEYGDLAAHVYDQEVVDAAYLKSEATCTSKALYYKSCVCGEKGSDTFEYGDLAAHVYDKEVAEATYLKSEATCTAKAVYYKSCVCGEKGTDTFEYGDVTAHVYDQEVVDAAYLHSAATCLDKAVYYKSCVCGEKGSDTFEYGDLASHDYVNGVCSVCGIISEGFYYVNGEYEIRSYEGLKYFRDSVNGGNSYLGATVNLVSDLNLNNEDWTPIGLNADSAAYCFKGTFNGNGYIISNLTVDRTSVTPAYEATGLFGALFGTVKNLVIDCATVSGVSAPSSEGLTTNGNAIVAGSLMNGAVIDGVTVKNSTLSGNRYVGTIAGYVYGSVTNCKVENVTVKATPDNLFEGAYDNGDKAGGIVGYFPDAGYKVENNTVSELTLTAARDMGAVVGMAGDITDVLNNNVDTATLYVDQSLLPSTKAYNAGKIVGRYSGTVDSTNTYLNVTIYLTDGFAIAGSDAYEILNIEGLKYFRDSVNGGNSYKGYTVTLAADIDLSSESNWTPIGTSSNPFRGIFDGGNKVISNLTVNDANVSYKALFGYIKCNEGDPTATVKNLYIENASVVGLHCTAVVVGEAFNGLVENVYVSGNVSVSGGAYVGTIVGKGYVNVKNCSVQANEGALVTASSSYLGGIVGWSGEGSYVIDACTVQGITLKGISVLGGVTALAPYGISITNCVLNDVVLIYTDYTTYNDPNGLGVIAGYTIYSATRNITITGNTFNGTIKSTAPTYNDYIVGLDYSNNAQTNLVMSNNVVNVIVEYVEGFVCYSATSYEISTVEGLKYFRDTVNNGTSYAGATVNLIKNLDLNNEAWTPIGQNSGNKFHGVFNGNGCTISNLYVDMTAESYSYDVGAGLFGWIEEHTNSVQILNVNIDGATINGTAYAGGIVGFNGGAGAHVISGCSVINSNISANKSVGGIVGHIDDDCVISNVTSTGNTITGVLANREWGVGAILGRISGNSTTTMTNVTVSGNTISQADATSSQASEYYGTNHNVITLDGNNI